MGPPSYIQSVVGRNVVMRRIPVSQWGNLKEMCHISHYISQGDVIRSLSWCFHSLPTQATPTRDWKIFLVTETRTAKTYTHGHNYTRFVFTAYWIIWHRDSPADIVTSIWAKSHTTDSLHGSQKDGHNFPAFGCPALVYRVAQRSLDTKSAMLKPIVSRDFASRVYLFIYLFAAYVATMSVPSTVYFEVDSSWNVMAHGDAREGKWRGKLANAVGSQYPSHYPGTWCIQHYYRWCAQLGCQ